MEPTVPDVVVLDDKNKPLRLEIPTSYTDEHTSIISPTTNVPVRTLRRQPSWTQLRQQPLKTPSHDIPAGDASPCSPNYDPSAPPRLEHVVQKLPPRSVIRGEEVREGRLGPVYSGEYRGVEVEINEVRFGTTVEEAEALVRRELVALYRLRHASFINYPIGLHQADDSIGMVMEKADNGDLAKYLKKGNMKNDWYSKAKVCMDVADAVREMHSNWIVHGNLKAKNVLDNLVLNADHSQATETQYLAPERLSTSSKLPLEQMKLADIYGFGLIMWEVATDGKEPFSEHEGDESSLKQAVIKGAIDVPSNIPAVFSKLIRSALEPDPSKRPMLTTILFDLAEYLAMASAAASSSKSLTENSDYEHGLFYYNTNNFDKAMECFEKAAARDHVYSLRMLGLCEKAVDRNPPKAFSWLERSANAGDLEGQFHLATCYETGYGVERNMETAIGWYKSSAIAGNADSLDRLYRAVSSERNEIVMNWFYSVSGLDQRVTITPEIEQAAEQGDAIAAQVLAKWYDSHGDNEQAVEWMLRAAETGNALAQDDLSTFYLAGIMLPEHGTRAFEMFKSAAQGGSGVAVQALCRIVAEEEGEPGNDDDGLGNVALRWIYAEVKYGLSDTVLTETRRLAVEGHRDAQYVLAKLLHSGTVPSDDPLGEEPLQWLRRAADDGHVKAQCVVGYWHRDHDPSGVQAFHWFLRAAVDGNAVAQYEAAECLLTGHGTQKDDEKALRWFKSAAIAGDAKAVARLCEMVSFEWAVDMESSWLDSKTFQWFHNNFRRHTPDRLLDGLKRAATHEHPDTELVLVKLYELEKSV